MKSDRNGAGIHADNHGQYMNAVLFLLETDEDVNNMARGACKTGRQKYFVSIMHCLDIIP